MEETTPTSAEAQARPSWFARVDRLIRFVEDTILATVLSVMIGLAVTQIVLRNVFDSGLLWADPLLRVMVLWVGLLGAMVATRMDKQITVDVLSRLLPTRWNAGARVVTDLFTAGVSLVLAWHSVRLVLDDRLVGTVAFAKVPIWVCEAILPVAFAVIGVEYLMHAGLHLRRAAIGGGGS
jgi:TRAP-type C4-dicarboxylate transport system permease small subunit